MDFRERFECEIKIRSSYHQDYSNAIELLESKYAPVYWYKNIDSKDIYFDTDNRLLLSQEHLFRFKYKRNGGINYNYKFPLGIETHVLVRREFYADVGFRGLDLGNHFHRKFPVLSHLWQLISSQTDSGNDFRTFEPRIAIEKKRHGFLLCHKKWGQFAVIMIDRLRARAIIDGETILGTTCEFSEFEIELRPRSVSSHQINALNCLVESLQQIGYSPSLESKYQFAMLNLDPLNQPPSQKCVVKKR